MITTHNATHNKIILKHFTKILVSIPLPPGYTPLYKTGTPV